MILVTGGTGKTGSRLAALLGERARVASRHPQGDQIRFDWSDPTTFAPALDGVEAVYLVAPTGETDLLPAMRPFLEAAGARRFVLLSSSALPAGGPLMGQVHAWLRDHVPAWVVLRPSWFMQNFSAPTDDVITSATGDGRVAFIDAGDIAAVAARALTDPSLPSGDHVLTGPEPLSYGDVARILSEVLGRPIRHRRLTVAELAQAHEAAGIPAEYARTLAALDEPIAAGAEDRTTSAVLELTGRPPRSFREFARREVLR